MTLRIVFMGTPDFAVPTLTGIVGAGHDVVAVYSQPPRPAGRGMAERKSPVHVAAEEFALPVLTPKSLRDETAQAAFAAHRADAAVVVAYGLILPAAVLEAPARGCFNLHASLLPRWRGAAPIQRAIMAGDAETGVAVMGMETGLDTGPICMEEQLAIGPDMTAGELHDQLAVLGGGLMARALAALSQDSLDCRPQDDPDISGRGLTYAKKIDKTETRIDWTLPANTVHDHIRGLSPFPGAWFEMNSERVKVLRSHHVEVSKQAPPGTLLDGDGLVACGRGGVRLIDVQRTGRQQMSYAQFARGARLEPGIVFE